MMTSVKVLTALLTLILLSGCQTRVLFVENDLQANADAILKAHDLFVVSNREHTDDAGLGLSHLRSYVPKFARLQVTVPKAHKYGRIEWARVKRSRPDRHFEVSQTEVFGDASGMLARINAQLASDTSGYKGIFLFVHGFNFSFPETVYQAAQIVHDTETELLPVVFSWPSRAALSGYGYDRESVTFSRDDLAGTLRMLAASEADSIMILAHSMGSMLTMEALRQLSLKNEKGVLSKIKHVTMASPDIDLSVFFRQLAAVDPRPSQFIVMTSTDDRALSLSQSLSRSDARLGKFSDAPVLARNGVDVVDISAISQRGPINHTKFSTRPAALGFVSLMSRLQHPAYTAKAYRDVIERLAKSGADYGLSVYPAE